MVWGVTTAASNNSFRRVDASSVVQTLNDFHSLAHELRSESDLAGLILAGIRKGSNCEAGMVNDWITNPG